MNGSYGAPLGGGLPPVVKNLLILNGVFYLLKLTLGVDATGRHVLDSMLGMYYVGSPLFKPWQLVTHMFMHGDFTHLFVNMFGLFMFGAPIERLWGPKRFLKYYVLTGFGAVALHTGINTIEVLSTQAELTAVGVSVEDVRDIAAQSNAVPWAQTQSSIVNLAKHHNAPVDLVYSVFLDNVGIMIGASGAIFGILLAFGMTFPNSIIMLLIPPIPMKAKYFVVIFGLFELFMGLRQSPGDNVAHFAHLGGMVFGFLLIRHWRKNEFRYR